MTWFVLSLIAILFWSGSDLFSKMGSKPEDKYSLWKMVMAVGTVMGLHAIVMLALGTPFHPRDIITYMPASAMYILSMVLGYASELEDDDALPPEARQQAGMIRRQGERLKSLVEDLNLTMKPCRYELDLRATQEDAAELRAYLAKHLRPGETVELWNLWVGAGPARPRRFSGALGDVELDTLKQLEENFQTCLTIRI